MVIATLLEAATRADAAPAFTMTTGAPEGLAANYTVGDQWEPDPEQP
jgi:hypothetical protein